MAPGNIRRTAFAAVTGIVFIVAGSVTYGAQLHFDQAEYTVAPGGSLRVEVRLDMDPATPGDQVPPGGLFSAGASVAFDPSMANVSAVGLPTSLSSSVVTSDPGYAGAAGAVDLFATHGYEGATVLTVDFSMLAFFFSVRPAFSPSSTPDQNRLHVPGLSARMRNRTT